ncbi:hypothetical protein [Thalassotalea sp. SU-HH00458]|uniref:hypothetical protein n=1 Tax=Thalassotalea sp. SU-HH00458 TaxID=3127657 RepID=UPI0033658396
MRFLLFKGLFGCRISLIKKGQQTRFDQLDNNDQLKLLFAGQGEDWPDSIILRSNQFNLTTSTEDESLFEMLAKERFDYFRHYMKRELKLLNIQS